MAARKKDLISEPEQEQAALEKSKSEKPVKTNSGAFGELARLVRDADRDERNLPALHRFYDENPNISDRFSLIGSIIRDNVLDSLTKKNASKLTLHQDFHALMKRLGRDEADALERVVIERIGMDWLRLLYTESQVAHCGTESVTWTQFEHMEKAHDRAHKRFIKSCEALAKLRALRAMTGRRPASVSTLRLADRSESKAG